MDNYEDKKRRLANEFECVESTIKKVLSSGPNFKAEPNFGAMDDKF